MKMKDLIALGLGLLRSTFSTFAMLLIPLQNHATLSRKCTLQNDI